MKITLIALLATLLATTLPGVCKETTKPESGKPTQTETTATPAAGALPATRTITDLKGPYEMAETDQILPNGKKSMGVGRTDPTIYKQVIDLALKLRK